jgi:hypothetical protein
MVVLHDRALLHLAMGLKARPALVVTDASQADAP